MKPSRVIILPLLTSIILMGWKLESSGSFDFSNRDDLRKIWYKFRTHFRNKKFKKDCDEFDIETVTADQVSLVKKILQPHSDLHFHMIRRECNTSACMFEWTNSVIEYFEIKQNLDSLGIKQIEDKIIHYQNINTKMIQVFERILRSQEFKNETD